MQIWVYPDRLANMGLTVSDLQDALKDQNRESAAGELGKQPVLDVDVTLPITAPGRLSTVKEFRGYRGASKPGWLDRPDERRGPGIAGGFLLFYGEWDQWEERRYLGYLYVAGGERSGGRHEGERGDEGYQQELPGRLGV